MNFDDTAKFGRVISTVGEHVCPQCMINGRANWTRNKIFCDQCLAIRASDGFWAEPTSKRLCPDCKRNELGYRKKVCPACAVKRRRKSERQSRRRKWGLTNATVKPVLARGKKAGRHNTAGGGLTVALKAANVATAKLT